MQHARKEMSMKTLVLFAAASVVAGSMLAGCARHQKTAAAPPPPAASPADAGYGLRAATVDFLPATAQAPMGLPPDAAPGDCYVRAVVPAQYDTVMERVVKKPASARVDVVPAQMEETQERVMVRPASKRIEVVPATYEDVEERVLVRPATTRLEVVPATTRTVTEPVVVRPASSMWKRSSELSPAERAQQKIDPSAGDILCLVQVPAEVKNVTREVIDKPATTRTVEVPAEYTTVKKTIVKTPATTREVEVPAEFRTVTVQKIVTPAREVKIDVPAEYEEVSKQVLKTPATTEWRAVLCDTNASPQTLTALQQSLRRAGFDPGRADGRIDAKTLNAVRAFQQSKGLPVDTDRYINMATVKALGVAP
jgi:hypothetical protein